MYKFHSLFAVVVSLLAMSFVSTADDTKYEAGEAFKDCDLCPEMMVIPAGSFVMGARENDTRANKKRELPTIEVTIADAFAIGKFEVTRDQYNECVLAGACTYSPMLMPWEKRLKGANTYPIVHVAWEDAQQYVGWLSEHTSRAYSLPSESEWEYAARGGTSTIYWWGDALGENNAHCVECGGGHPFTGDHKSPLPVGSYSPNPYGLYDMVGNVAEHMQDCFTFSINEIPLNGRSHLFDGCKSHALRGSSYDGLASSRQTRLSSRSGTRLLSRKRNYSFRVRRTLNLPQVSH